MAEDIFGLSLRGLKTMRDLVVRPSLVFDAARCPDWLDRYTPSMRLFSSLVALMLLLRIFWAGDDSVMYQSMVGQLEQLVANGTLTGDPAQLAESYFGTWALAFPVVYLLVHFLVSMTVKIWGPDASRVTRIRLYFAALVPGIMLANLTLLATPLIAPAYLAAFTIVYLVLCVLAYGTTAYLGLKASFASPYSRLWRGALFALIAILTDTASSLLSNVVGGAIAAFLHISAI